VVKSLGNNIHTKPPEKDKKQKEKLPWQALVGRYLSISSQNIAFIGAGGVLGWYLDKKFGTNPLFLIIGIFAGAVAGFYYMIRLLNELHKHTDE